MKIKNLFKRFFVWLLILPLAFVFSGCNKAATPANNSTNGNGNNGQAEQGQNNQQQGGNDANNEAYFAVLKTVVESVDEGDYTATMYEYILSENQTTPLAAQAMPVNDGDEDAAESETFVLSRKSITSYDAENNQAVYVVYGFNEDSEEYDIYNPFESEYIVKDGENWIRYYYVESYNEEEEGEYKAEYVSPDHAAYDYAAGVDEIVSFFNGETLEECNDSVSKALLSMAGEMNDTLGQLDFSELENMGYEVTFEANAHFTLVNGVYSYVVEVEFTVAPTDAELTEEAEAAKAFMDIHSLEMNITATFLFDTEKIIGYNFSTELNMDADMMSYVNVVSNTNVEMNAEVEFEYDETLMPEAADLEVYGEATYAIGSINWYINGVEVFSREKTMNQASDITRNNLQIANTTIEIYYDEDCTQLVPENATFTHKSYEQNFYVKYAPNAGFGVVYFLYEVENFYQQIPNIDVCAETASYDFTNAGGYIFGILNDMGYEVENYEISGMTDENGEEITELAIVSGKSYTVIITVSYIGEAYED